MRWDRGPVCVVWVPVEGGSRESREGASAVAQASDTAKEAAGTEMERCQRWGLLVLVMAGAGD